MAERKIVWTLRAKTDRILILEFWIAHNKSASYSRKLNSLFREAVQFVAKYPTIGKLTDDKSARVKIVRHYLLVYEVSESEITILTIFDSRRRPER